MIDREKRYSEELTSCRKSIKRTKRLIEYHKNMLKSLEAQDRVLSEKLEKEKISVFYNLLNKKGYDIDAFKNAIESGDFDKILTERSETVTLEGIPAIDKELDEIDEISQSKTMEVCT